MPRPSHYDILFDSVKIGPVTAKNRFYQVPHCTGLGWLRPQMVAELRHVKAQGGWGVVNTEYCSIHPSSDDLPFPYHSLWDDHDINAHRLMTDKVHQHGALAGVELWAGGARAANLFSREIPVDVASIPIQPSLPRQTRRMDKKDIADLRAWHRKAALRAKAAEFDIVYVYATHDYLLAHFLSRTTNDRRDEYGGSLENRARIVKELIQETKEAVGDRCAVAVRFSANGNGDADNNPDYNNADNNAEQQDLFAMLAELPDLWDINISDYNQEMGASRFVKEAALEPYLRFVKSATSKPVVSVGRFTSPDTMVAQIKRGILDFIGAARPSIADPYLPNKIMAGDFDDIRECIGCNICYASDSLAVPIRCTQNPTMGEEWRRQWHPEKIAAKKSNSHVLIVGGGPSGLEAARALGQRGYQVSLAEASATMGGRVAQESALPGLSEWLRVRDYRLQQLNKLPNVAQYLQSELNPQHIMQLQADHVVIATGARWRKDGFGRSLRAPLKWASPPPSPSPERIFSPDDLMAGAMPQGITLVYDDDNYYMASVLAEKIALSGGEVIYATSGDKVAAWCAYTDEQQQVQRRLMALGITIITQKTLAQFADAALSLACIYTQQITTVKADNLLLVTARTPNDALYYALQQQQAAADSPAFSLSKIGDCDAPGLIVDAVFAGHRYARELDETPDSAPAMRHDRQQFRRAP